MFGLSFTAIKLAVIGLVFLAYTASVAYLTHRVDASKYQALELQYAQAQAEAVAAAQAEQKRLDAIATDAAKKEAATQAALTAHVRRQLAEVQKHVKTLGPRGCVTYGLVRVLDAAVHGVIADSLALPAGKSDDACTGIDAATLARSVVDNYGTAKLNAEQLNALIEVTRKLHEKK
jgi:hypothetical protein